jgi:hypothetical protein
MLSFDTFENKTKKTIIFKILIREQFLSARKIHFLLKKKFFISQTYQATYKILNELVKKGILEKNSFNYSLSTAWVEKQYFFLKKIYLSKKNIKTIYLISKDFEHFSMYCTLRDIEDFISNFIFELELKKSKNVSLYVNTIFKKMFVFDITYNVKQISKKNLELQIILILKTESFLVYISIPKQVQDKIEQHYLEKNIFKLFKQKIDFEVKIIHRRLYNSLVMN